MMMEQSSTRSNENKYDVIVVGAGPSGMMAALAAKTSGCAVLLLEKNPVPGKKLLLTGHGRCNLTNIRIMDNFRETYHENARFLTSAFHAFSPEDVRAFFQSLGLPSHEEDAGRIFPDTQKAASVCDALVKALEKEGVVLSLSSRVEAVSRDEKSAVWHVKTSDAEYAASAVILATGGKSFPHTGSEGDGYRLAESAGHTVTPVSPALAPIFLPAMDMAGITLPDVGTALIVEGKKRASSRGDLLFTHQGVSGPAAMSLSRYLPGEREKYEDGQVLFSIDMLPDMREEEVETALLSAMSENPNRHMKRILCETFHLQEKAAISVLSEGKEGTGADAKWDICAREVRKETRKEIVTRLKNSAFRVEKCTPMEIAYVTCGGVSVKEIDPKTMGSKKKDGLFFAGELIDVDGISGGYNLQNAWATGRAAGLAAAQYAGNV